MREGKGSLVYVGDGINDVPSITRADVGVAMGGIGSDSAVEAADLVIMNDSLRNYRRPSGYPGERVASHIRTSCYPLVSNSQCWHLPPSVWLGCGLQYSPTRASAAIAIINGTRAYGTVF